MADSHMAGRISNGAARVYLALQQLAGSTGLSESTLEADYNEICAAAVRARASVSSGIRELVAAGWITQHKRYGHKAAYTLHPPFSSQNSCSISSVVQKFNSSEVRTTGAILNIPNQSAADISAAAAETTSLNSDQSFRKMCALLSEFNIGEPVRSQLARLLVDRNGQESELRRIYETTREEWQAGKVRKLAGMTVTRLRDYAEGLQLPLFEVAPMPGNTLPKRSHSRGGRKTAGKALSRRPHDLTDADRAAADETAKRQLEEIRQRRLAQQGAIVNGSNLTNGAAIP